MDEAKEQDSSSEEESEDEDIVLADNTIQPGPFKNADSIVCLGTEPDKAMVNIEKFLLFYTRNKQIHSVLIEIFFL